jgi:hypothetical protein
MAAAEQMSTLLDQLEEKITHQLPADGTNSVQ